MKPWKSAMLKGMLGVAGLSSARRVRLWSGAWRVRDTQQSTRRHIDNWNIKYMTISSQTLTRSVFDQFTTPDKKDKNKMLMYLRGMIKPESTTTVKVTTQQYGFTSAPDSLIIKQVWEGKGLPDRSDKSKMLAYLRGMNAPNGISTVYEDPQHRGVIQTLETQNTENTQNTANTKNTVVDFKNTDPQVSWGSPAASTQPIILQPEKESESDTCFWRGQQSPDNSYRSQLVDTDKFQKQGPKKPKDEVKESGSEFENMGENVIKFWDCIRTKFYKSYDRIKDKICGMFEG
ncbi:uncharacterized protein LOC133527889 [Cydia pomonella]|uniref:uncharacterized protein LOC133527889 n=1 Tax=Cydia pomonella TaxID=82600 RepID=UPI002ADDC05E|nr:uncharacterized protein LOC133527889 [Cydia pomonella]